MKSHRHHLARDDVAAPYTEDTADSSQNMHEIGIQGTVAAHINAQIGVHAPAAGRHQAAQLPHLFIVNLANPGSALGVKVFEP